MQFFNRILPYNNDKAGLALGANFLWRRNQQILGKKKIKKQECATENGN
jgi:hypothetical protein